MKKMIALVPLWDEEKDSYWMLPGYMDGITAAGGIPIILPLTDSQETLTQLAHDFDGFLFTGGHDLSPSLYGEETSPACKELCPARDSMEMPLLKEVLHLNKPVLGICRGVQLLNTVLGGSLYQDLPSQHPSPLEHRQKAPYDLPAHAVTILLHSPLHQLLRKEELAVNSCHHQGIKRLADALEPMAQAPDGLIEAVYMPEKSFVWGLQWHPEFSRKTDENSQKIFDAFVASAKG